MTHQYGTWNVVYITMFESIVVSKKKNCLWGLCFVIKRQLSVRSVYMNYEAKAFPLHVMEALGRRGDIAPTHSGPRH
jgi:hypothetical protein